MPAGGGAAYAALRAWARRRRPGAQEDAVADPAPTRERRAAVVRAAVTSVLAGVAAAVAVTVELVEAMAIVLAVGVSRSWTDALWGAAAGVLACAGLALTLGPVMAGLPVDALRLVIGTLLLLFGLEWLRKGVLRLSGRRARSSAQREFADAQEELGRLGRPAAGPDWAARSVAFKGVLLEGVEIVVIVAALASRPTGPTPAIIGAAAAGVVTLGIGVRLRRPLAAVPESELKYGVGLLLTAFGIFFAGEGLGVRWPLGDVAVLYLGAWLLLATRLQIAASRRSRERG